MDGLMNVEQKNVSLLLLDNPELGEINESPAVDEHKHFHSVVDARFFYTRVEVGVSRDWIDLVLDVFALEHFLANIRYTDSILSVQTESTSTPTNMTIET
jgi:hypothetical protein